MDDPDAFFTLTIVGAPASLVLGRRMLATEVRAQGLEVPLDTGVARLSAAWRDLALLRRGHAIDGRPFCRPGRVLCLLERHALAIALAGACCLAASAGLAGVLLWR